MTETSSSGVPAVSAIQTWETHDVRSSDGTTIVYRLVGRGLPLVIVHGGANTARDYGKLAAALADRFAVHLVERRNYGFSGASGSPHSFDQESADVAAVIRATGAPADVFGHSAGALVSLHAAREYPELVRRLALYEPPLSAAGAHILETLDRQKKLIAQGQILDALVLGYVALLGMDADVARQRLALKSATLDELARQTVNDVEAWAALDPDATRWRSLTMPTLLLRGTESVEHPLRDSIDRLHDALPNSSVEELLGQDHVAHILAPEMVASSLRAFFL
jgi:pimeloyl-ACP methyl ester carboxylesterase